MVSARTLLVFKTLAAWALASSASFRPSTADDPQRVVIFISVVGCGTAMPNGIRQKRCHEIESATSRHKRLEPQAVAVLQEHQPQVGLDRHRRATEGGVEVGPERLEEGRIVQQAVDRLQLGRASRGTSRGGSLPTRWAARLPFST